MVFLKIFLKVNGKNYVNQGLVTGHRANIHV